MKVNVLRINSKNLNDDERIHIIDYNELIKNKVLVLVQGEYIYRDEVTEVYQDNFDFLRITTKSGDKFRISPSKDVDLEKDLKTQQVKDVLDEINEKYVVFIETKDNNFLLSYIDDDSFERRELSKDNESLEDFILRIGETFVNNK